MQKITDGRGEKQKWRQNGEGKMQEWEHGRTDNRKKKGSEAKGEQGMEILEVRARRVHGRRDIFA